MQAVPRVPAQVSDGEAARLRCVTEPEPRAAAARGGVRLVLAAVLALQVLALAGFAAFYLYELVLGDGASPARVVMSVVLLVLSAVGLGAMARAWARGERWPRTPTMVWSALLLPVAWGLLQGDRAGLGAVVGAAGLVGLGAALAVPSRHGPGVAD